MTDCRQRLSEDGDRPANRLAVAVALREAAALLEIEGTSPFRIRAYERGAEAVESLDAHSLAELVRSNRLITVPGIGPALARTIRELVETGRCDWLERLRQSVPPGAAELRTVLTRRRMKALHDALGIASLAELTAACEAGRVREVAGFGARSERRILDAIRSLPGASAERLLDKAVAEGDRLLGRLRAHPAVEIADLAGDARRRRETVDRLVLIAASEDAIDVVDDLVAAPGVIAVVERTPAGAVVRLAGGPDVELRVVPRALYVATLHEATGSPAHVNKLRRIGARRRFLLGGGTLTQNGRSVQLRGEADIYRHLGLQEVPPELREDAGEVEAALAGALPGDLVRLEDLQGLVHCHTTYSDGRRSIADMARAADELGMRYITITDHSPTARYAKGLTVDRLKRQWEEIERVQETVSVRILRGTESDILRDGSLDYPDAVLEQMDVVIASIHNRHGMDADAMTERLVRAMRHPLFKLWGHALGRYVLRRPPLACHMERVLEAVGESRAAIEINGDPHRLDLEPRWIREARRYGIRFVVSTDAHSVNGLRNARWGVDMARRGWVRRVEVLNTRDAAGFRAAVRPLAGGGARAETSGRA